MYVIKIKYLGFWINNTLSSTDYINHIVRNVYLLLRNLRLSSNFTPVEGKRKLIIQLILTLINYFAEVYSEVDSPSHYISCKYILIMLLGMCII